MTDHDGSPHLAETRSQLKRLRTLLSISRAKQVQAMSIVNTARKVVNYYFSETQPAFTTHGLDQESLAGLDNWMQQLLTLTQKAALKAAYEQTVKAVSQELNGVEVALLTASPGRGPASPPKLDGKESRITSTLYGLVATAGLSYEQACLDLRDTTRLSFRGVAAELREALREVLDHLAPDRDVQAQPNFKLEKNRPKPTMKQKVRFILSFRGKGKSLTEAPENAVSIVEDRVGALARSVYNRSSVSTHVGSSKQEVQQIKAYVDVVLGELLEIA